jgi:hypothetical protein
MNTSRIRRLATLIALIAVNIVLLFVAITAGLSPLVIGMAALLGATIGIFHERGKYSSLSRVLAGTAGGLFVCIGLMMSVFGYLLR